MKKQFLALGAIATLFFACSGGGDKFVGRWIGNYSGKADTFNVVKDGENYSLTHGGTKMSATGNGDTLTVAMGGGSVKFGYNKTSGQLTIAMGPNKFSYDKK
jgi:hypothetical protein